MKNFKEIIKKSTKNTNFKIDTKKVKNVEVVFLDLEGKIREITIPKAKLKDAIINGLKCDGSSIGFEKTTRSDINIIVDNSRIYPLPNGNIMIISHTDFAYDPRKKLIKLEQLLPKYKINIGVEIECFIVPNTNKLDDLNYFEIDNGETIDCLNEIMSYCEEINFPIESFHHECGHSQFEINFKYNIPHKTADNIIFLKKLIAFFASKHSLSVNFLPKPFEKECGSGMHTNISISENKNNLFYCKDDKFKLSKFGYEFAKNIINHVPAIAYISNPCKNSYDRLNLGKETPKNIDICAFDRTALIRVPMANENSARIEFRMPDCQANPYLLFFAIIIAGFDNLTPKNLQDIYLPKTLDEAKKCFIEDDLFKNLLPNIK